MSSITWWLYWILAYTAGLASLTVDVVGVVRRLSTKESVVFSASFLFLIIAATMSEYQNHYDIFILRAQGTREMEHFWYHALMVALIGIFITIPLWVHSVRTVAAAGIINCSMGFGALLLLLFYVASLLFGFTTEMITVILLAVIGSALYGLLQLLRSPYGVRTDSPLNFNRLLAIVTLALLPPVVMFDMFYNDLDWLQRLSPVRLTFFPLLYIIFCLIRSIDGIIRLSSRRIDKPIGRINWNSIAAQHHITDREMDVVKLLMEGKNYHEIGSDLFISISTVKTHIRSIYRKTDSSNKVELLSMLYSG